MVIMVEIFFMKIFRKKVLYRKHTVALGLAKDPDAAVSEAWSEKFCGSPELLREKCIAHSTSWRYDNKAGCVVLTYIFYSETLDLSCENASVIAFDDLKFPHELCPETSCCDHLKEENVLAHGVRHLGLLVKLDSNSFRGKIGAPAIKLLKRKDVLGPAGRLQW